MIPELEIDSNGLQTALTAFSSRMNKPDRLIRAGLNILEAGVREPRDTGRLARSKTLRVGAGVGELTWAAPYAGFVHAGTRYMTADPFAADVVLRRTGDVIEVIEDGMSSEMKSSGLK